MPLYSHWPSARTLRGTHVHVFTGDAPPLMRRAPLCDHYNKATERARKVSKAKWREQSNSKGADPVAAEFANGACVAARSAATDVIRGVKAVVAAAGLAGRAREAARTAVMNVIRGGDAGRVAAGLAGGAYVAARSAILDVSHGIKAGIVAAGLSGRKSGARAHTLALR
jgi:transcriptional regulator GlxA family with amidase domain